MTFSITEIPTAIPHHGSKAQEFSIPSDNGPMARAKSSSAAVCLSVMVIKSSSVKRPASLGPSLLQQNLKACFVCSSLPNVNAPHRTLGPQAAL
jgi:hypothetical protein